MVMRASSKKLPVVTGTFTSR